MITLMPRLSNSYASFLAEEYSEMAVEEARSKAQERLSDVLANTSYAATGGRRAREDELNGFSDHIRSVAEDCGYPDQRRLSEQRDFDLRVTTYLDDFGIIPAEAARGEVWQYLTCALLPDVVIWRFGKTSSGVVGTCAGNTERFLGSERNLLGRLYWRLRILKDSGAEEPYRFLDGSHDSGLSEDNMVSLVERTGVSRHPELSLIIAKHFERIREAVRASSVAEEEFFREVMKRIVRRSAFMAFSGLKLGELERRVEENFTKTLNLLGVEPVSTARETVATIYDATPESLHSYISEAVKALESRSMSEIRHEVEVFEGKMERLSRRVPTIELELVKELVSTVQELTKEVAESTTDEELEALRGAAGYLMEEDDKIKFFEVGGFEDDREVVNGAARVLSRPDLAVEWSGAVKSEKEDNVLDVPYLLRSRYEDSLSRIEVGEGDPKLLGRLRNIRVFVGGDDQEDSVDEVVSRLAGGYERLVSYLSAKDMGDAARRIVQTGIVCFEESLESAEFHGEIQAHVQMFNESAGYLGREDLTIEVEKG